MINEGKVVLYLMRHGQTILNKTGRTQGWCDSVLTKEGIEVAVNVGLGLRDVKFKAAYSSDMSRAIKTARIVIKENKESNHLEVQEFEGLRELYFGKYEGELESVRFKEFLDYLNISSFEEIERNDDYQKQYCDTFAALDETKEAEDYDTVIKRSIGCINKIFNENSNENGGNVLVVAHGRIIKIIIDYFDKNFDTRNINNSSVSKIIYENGEIKVESVNDNSYSEKGKAIIKEIN